MVVVKYSFLHTLQVPERDRSVSFDLQKVFQCRDEVEDSLMENLDYDSSNRKILNEIVIEFQEGWYEVNNC